MIKGIYLIYLFVTNADYVLAVFANFVYFIASLIYSGCPTRKNNEIMKQLNQLLGKSSKNNFSNIKNNLFFRRH